LKQRRQQRGTTTSANRDIPPRTAEGEEIKEQVIHALNEELKTVEEEHAEELEAVDDIPPANRKIVSITMARELAESKLENQVCTLMNGVKAWCEKGWFMAVAYDGRV
jgi:vacuolar-type H+-ATPase subunit I/STV1